MQGVAKYENPLMTVFDLILHFFRNGLLCSMCAKFEIFNSNRSRDTEGSHNLKSRSRDPFPTPLTQFWIFFRYCPWFSICLPNLKFLAKKDPEMLRGPTIAKVSHVTHSRPPVTKFCIFVTTPRDQFACQIWSF